MNATEPEVEREGLPLRRPKLTTAPVQPQERPIYFACSSANKDYIEDVKALERKSIPATDRRDQSDIINDALVLERRLTQLLEQDGDRLAAFAETAGLDMDEQLPEVLARLVKVGLDIETKKTAAKR